MLIDSHCHLDYFLDELPALLDRAAAAGVGELVTIGTTLDQSLMVRDLATRHDGLWCTIGVHPQSAGNAPIPSPEALAEMADHPKVVGIGESGLDYFYQTAAQDVQKASFRAHIRSARLAGIPICIHARDADADIAAILREEREEGGHFDFLLHCFSSGRGLAEAALELGGYFSFAPAS